MKKYIFILLTIMIFNCKAQETKSNVLYFLPVSVREVLTKEIKKKNSIDKDVFIVLEQENKEVYVLYLNTNPNKSEKFWLQYSNRAVFLEKNLIIPFYFYMDEIFSYSEKADLVLKKLGTEEGISKTISIRENAFQIKFKIDGEIVSSEKNSGN